MHITPNKFNRFLIIITLLTSLLLSMTWLVMAATSSPHAVSSSFDVTWDYRIADPGGDPDSAIAHAVVGGRQAVVYYDNVAQALRYVISADLDGITWSVPIVITPVTSIDNVALIDANGMPAIAYVDTDNEQLYYMRATHLDGSSWGTPIALTAANGANGYNFALLHTDGFPAVIYQTQAVDALHIIRATNADGSSWGAAVTIASTANELAGFGVQQINGFPAVAYYNDTPTNGLYYVRATNAQGSSWGTPLHLDSVPSAGSPSLAVVNGKPAIAYSQFFSRSIRYISATDVNGAAWNSAETVLTDTNNYHTNIALTAYNGNQPLITYYRRSNEVDIGSILGNNAQGNSWGSVVYLGVDERMEATSQFLHYNGIYRVVYINSTHTAVQTADTTDGTTWTIRSIAGGIAGEYIVSALINGKPAVLYADYNKQTLNYVQANDTSGTSWGQPHVVLNSSPRAFSLAEVNGKPAIVYAVGLGIASRVPSPNQVYFVQATISDGSSWGTPVELADERYIGNYPQLFVVNGHPAVGYVNLGARTINYVRANDADGASWNAPDAIYLNPDGQSHYLTAAIIDGKPAFAFSAPTQDESVKLPSNIQYLVANDANGANWGNAAPVESSSVTIAGGNNRIALAEVDGYAAVGFVNDDSDAVLYSHATNISGTTWSEPITVATDIRVETRIDLTVADGVPTLAFRNLATTNLYGIYFAHAQDIVGNVWNAPQVVRSMMSDSAAFGRYLSATPINNAVGIAYSGNAADAHFTVVGVPYKVFMPLAAR